MRNVLLSMAAGVVGLALAGTANAQPVVVGGHPPAVGVRAYYRDHGVRFSGGYYYVGRDDHHWTRRVWDPVHHRYHYYDPYLRVYYYWDPARQCYYPIDYCP
jgi:hypothetical protein